MKTINITHWIAPSQVRAEVNVWRVGQSDHAEMSERMTVAINTGAASLHLNPTREEASALIAALQWAMEG